MDQIPAPAHVMESRGIARTLKRFINRGPELSADAPAGCIERPASRPPRWIDCMAARRFVKPLLFVGIPIAAVVAFWNWDWFITIVQGRASALGRPVTIAHLHVQLGRVTTVNADDMRIANPPAFQRAVISSGSPG